MGTPAVRMGWMLQLDAWRRSLQPAALSPVNYRAADPFERLFVQEYAKVVAIAYRVLADRTAAEDVAQEVFLKFHRSFNPDSERASGWLHAAAVHSALNVIRGERRRAQRETAHALDRSLTAGSAPGHLGGAAGQRRGNPAGPGCRSRGGAGNGGEGAARPSRWSRRGIGRNPPRLRPMATPAVAVLLAAVLISGVAVTGVAGQLVRVFQPRQIVAVQVSPSGVPSNLRLD